MITYYCKVKITFNKYLLLISFIIYTLSLSDRMFWPPKGTGRKGTGRKGTGRKGISRKGTGRKAIGNTQPPPTH